MGLLYWTSEKQILENKAMEEAKHTAEIKAKVATGKTNMYYKPNMNKKLKEDLLTAANQISKGK